jgi:bifunctional non-homologous end joining protein LigD
VAFQRKKPSGDRYQGAAARLIEPALATGIAKVPSGERWIHEIKFDGYRVQVHIANAEAKVTAQAGAFRLPIG